MHALNLKTLLHVTFKIISCNLLWVRNCSNPFMSMNFFNLHGEVGGWRIIVILTSTAVRGLAG